MFTWINNADAKFLMFCAIPIVVLFLFNLKNWKRKFINYQSVIYIMAIAGCIFESVAFAVAGNLKLIWLQYAANMLYFASISTVGVCMFFYCNECLLNKLINIKKYALYISIPYFINIISLCFAPKFHIVFGINSAAHYYRTSTYIIQMTPLIYLVFTIICSCFCYYKCEITVLKTKALSTLLLGGIPLLAGFSEVCFPNDGFDLMEYSILISLIIDLLLLQNSKIAGDSLTNLLNKDSFNSIVYEKMNRKKSQGYLYLLMCDMDNFKSINDVYGHVVGDDALITFAQVLTEISAKYNSIASRFGGDEFAIVVESDSEEKVLEFIRDINRMVEEKTKEKEYSLEMSVGYARYEGNCDITGLFIAADKMLYNVKKAKNASVIK